MPARRSRERSASSLRCSSVRLARSRRCRAASAARLAAARSGGSSDQRFRAAGGFGLAASADRGVALGGGLAALGVDIVRLWTDALSFWLFAYRPKRFGARSSVGGVFASGVRIRRARPNEKWVGATRKT
jgi:hypothetical protein